jgi:putative transposase
MPESLEALDLLLVMVATPRTVHRDGIRFQGIRYIDPTLAAFVGERVTIRYDPRDLGEVRVFHRDRCRAISPTHASEQISLKDIEAARRARRRALRGQITERVASAADHKQASWRAAAATGGDGTTGPPPSRPRPPQLRIYREEEPDDPRAPSTRALRRDP